MKSNSKPKILINQSLIKQVESGKFCYAKELHIAELRQTNDIEIVNSPSMALGLWLEDSITGMYNENRHYLHHILKNNIEPLKKEISTFKDKLSDDCDIDRSSYNENEDNQFYLDGRLTTFDKFWDKVLTIDNGFLHRLLNIAHFVNTIGNGTYYVCNDTYIIFDDYNIMHLLTNITKLFHKYYKCLYSQARKTFNTIVLAYNQMYILNHVFKMSFQNRIFKNINSELYSFMRESLPVNDYGYMYELIDKYDIVLHGMTDILIQEVKDPKLYEALVNACTQLHDYFKQYNNLQPGHRLAFNNDNMFDTILDDLNIPDNLKLILDNAHSSIWYLQDEDSILSNFKYIDYPNLFYWKNSLIQMILHKNARIIDLKYTGDIYSDFNHEKWNRIEDRDEIQAMVYSYLNSMPGLLYAVYSPLDLSSYKNVIRNSVYKDIRVNHDMLHNLMHYMPVDKYHHQEMFMRILFIVSSLDKLYNDEKLHYSPTIHNCRYCPLNTTCAFSKFVDSNKTNNGKSKQQKTTEQ